MHGRLISWMDRLLLLLCRRERLCVAWTRTCISCTRHAAILTSICLHLQRSLLLLYLLVRRWLHLLLVLRLLLRLSVIPREHARLSVRLQFHIHGLSIPLRRFSLPRKSL